MFNLFEIAFAESGDAAAPGLLGGSPIIMIVIMIAIFYFMLIRPENKRKKEAEQMRNSLKKGDWLTTIGGLYGKVVAITDRTVVLESSEDRVRVEFLKSAIGTVGTLDEQEAAAQRKPKAKKEAAEEAAAEEPKAIEEATEE